MTKPDFDAAKAYALRRLTHELPPNRHYHSLQHTRDDVVTAADEFAAGEGISGDDLLCLLTAAYFHDLGHIEQSNGHEAISARIAAEVLPEFGYSPQQIETIQRLIMATKVPQTIWKRRSPGSHHPTITNKFVNLRILNNRFVIQVPGCASIGVCPRRASPLP